MKRIIYTLLFSATLGGNALAQDDQATLASHDEKIQKIFKTDEGVFRGVDFTTKKDTIKSAEDMTLLLEKGDALMYQMQIDEHEDVDIIYYIDEESQTLEGVSIAVMVKNHDEEDNLMHDLVDYFTAKYGDYTVTGANQDKVWYAEDDGYRIEMGDASDEETLELEIEIIKI